MALERIKTFLTDLMTHRCCFNGFDMNNRICVNHLELAYNEAKRREDKELMAAILWKRGQTK